MGNIADMMLWHTKELLPDETLEENAIMINEANKCVLLLDPQGQGLQFIIKKHQGKIKQLKQSDDYLKDIRIVC